MFNWPFAIYSMLAVILVVGSYVSWVFFCSYTISNTILGSFIALLTALIISFIILGFKGPK